jgi:hypothetical protein
MMAFRILKDIRVWWIWMKLLCDMQYFHFTVHIISETYIRVSFLLDDIYNELKNTFSFFFTLRNCYNIIRFLGSKCKWTHKSNIHKLINIIKTIWQKLIYSAFVQSVLQKYSNRSTKLLDTCWSMHKFLSTTIAELCIYITEIHIHKK